MAGTVAVAAVISAVAGVASIYAQQQASKKAEKRAAAAARERREAAAIEKAGARNTDTLNRRKALREERVKRAHIIQSAQGAGVSGSSGALSAPGIVGTTTAAGIAAQTSGRKAAEGVSDHRQSAADYTQSAKNALAQGDMFSSLIQTFGSVGSGLVKSGLFDPSPTVKPSIGQRKPGYS